MLDAQIDHVAVAVRDIATALPLYVDGLGGQFLFAGDNVEQAFRWAQFRYPGGGKFELVTPLSADGFVQRFLDSRGEGVHHVTLKVPDIHAAIAHLGSEGIALTRVSTEHRSWKEAFIHPKVANGVLIQVVQSAFSDEQAARHHLSDHTGSDHAHLTLQDLLG